MSYTRRMQSEGNVYHVITRGVGQQIIFEDDLDRRTLLDLLFAEGRKRNVELLCWCLMGNHVHLLVRGELPSVSAMMQVAKSKYARGYNRRYLRKGVLFQERFTSVPIESDEQLVAAVRYIHLNPVKAGGSLRFRWSSYTTYLDDDDFPSKAFVLDVFGGVEAFKRLHAEEADDRYGARLPRRRLSEADALELARSVLGGRSAYDVASLAPAERNQLLRQLKDAGLSIRQVVRLTSLGQGIVARA